MVKVVNFSKDYGRYTKGHSEDCNNRRIAFIHNTLDLFFNFRNFVNLRVSWMMYCNSMYFADIQEPHPVCNDFGRWFSEVPSVSLNGLWRIV